MHGSIHGLDWWLVQLVHGHGLEQGREYMKFMEKPKTYGKDNFPPAILMQLAKSTVKPEYGSWAPFPYEMAAAAPVLRDSQGPHAQGGGEQGLLSAP